MQRIKLHITLSMSVRSGFAYVMETKCSHKVKPEIISNVGTSQMFPHEKQLYNHTKQCLNENIRMQNGFIIYYKALTLDYRFWFV